MNNCDAAALVSPSYSHNQSLRFLLAQLGEKCWCERNVVRKRISSEHYRKNANKSRSFASPVSSRPPHHAVAEIYEHLWSWSSIVTTRGQRNKWKGLLKCINLPLLKMFVCVCFFQFVWNFVFKLCKNKNHCRYRHITNWLGKWLASTHLHENYFRI